MSDGQLRKMRVPKSWPFPGPRAAPPKPRKPRKPKMYYTYTPPAELEGATE